MIDDILRMVDTGCRVPFDTNGLRSLCTGGKDQRAGSKASKFVHRDVFVGSDRHVSEIMHGRAFQNFPVGLPEPSAELQLAWENAILRQAAEFDVTIQNHHLMASLGQQVGHRHPGWASPYHDDQVCPSTACHRTHRPVPRSYE